MGSVGEEIANKYRPEKLFSEYWIKRMGARKLDNLVSSDAAQVAVRKPIVADHSRDHEESGEISIPDKAMPLSAEWVSEELLLQTRNIWSQAYKRVISIDEAIEILMNVKRVAEVLIRIHKEGHAI